MNSIDIEKLLELLNNKSINIIDIRTKYEYMLNHIPTSKNIEKILLKIAPEKYLNSKEIYYIYCQSGYSSKALVEYLNTLGYNTVNINGGYNNYLLRK